MTLNEIEALAYQDKPFVGGSTPAEKYYYLAIKALYSLHRTNRFYSKNVCADIKKGIKRDYDKLSYDMAYIRYCAKISLEVDKVTAPLADLENKSKDELLIIVHKILKAIDGVGMGVEVENEY